MNRFFKKDKKKVTLTPQTLNYCKVKTPQKIKITNFKYNESKYQEKEGDIIDEFMPSKDKGLINWVNIDGISQPELLEKIGNALNLHPLVLEDISNTDQRPKMDVFEEYIYIIFKILHYNEKDYCDEEDKIATEQISVILGSNFVFSLTEKPGNPFKLIFDRIRTEKSHLRKSGSDFLVYSIMDVIIDNYFTILEKIGEKMEDLEEELVAQPGRRTLQEIHNMKKNLVLLRKTIWPLREIINRILRRESGFILQSTLIYFRDVYDHTVQIIDTIETYRDILAGMLDIYLSSINVKMQEIMKVLTIIATIFIPMTFIASLYGMNFKYLPEIYWEWGYPLILFEMLSILVIMLFYFRRKKWI